MLREDERFTRYSVIMPSFAQNVNVSSCSEVGAGTVRAVLQDMISQKLWSPHRPTHRFTLSSKSDRLDTLAPL
jgi:hypothetical protein